METPICVIDAKTLVDHIQDLKKWVYSGQLNLVVPSCTTEQVEQLYQKSIEPKPTAQEAPRSRSSGKPLKKEYPAFDINPCVAREFLGRLKTRKEQDAESEQRMFFQEKENHEAVHFQQPSEQYAPWRDLDVEEEKLEAVEGPPTSWAEALRRKQNLANGISEKSMSKAPMKPKLVARVAGSETSPWKVKKDAPKISAKDVPGALRPLMSCALWRLHESIERNDPNQLFLLSDQTEIKSVAHKLNIIVQSCKEVGAIIACKFSRTDLDTFGDLERDFGVQQRIAIFPTQDANEANGEHSVPDNASGDLPKDEDVMNKSVFSEGTTNTEASSIVRDQDLESHSSKHEEEKILANGERFEDQVTEQDTAEKAASFAAGEGSKKPAKSVESIKSLVDNIIQQDFQKNLSGSVNGLNIDDVKGQMNMANEPALEYPGIGSPPKTPLPQPQSMEPVQRLQEGQIVNRTSSSKHTTTTSTSILEAEGEPEDSDEEVVVFIPQPKRFSAQQKPAHQSSRPSTPKEQAQQKPVGQSPQKSMVKSHSKGKAARHSPNPSVIGHAHPQPVNSPTIIDPDAFGRDSRVNLNPSPRLPHNASGHPNHRNRGNMQNSQGGQTPRNSPRQLARMSPPHNSPQENSRRHIPIPAPASKGTPNHRRQTSRTSPRRDPAPKAEGVTSTNVESQATTATVSSKSQLPDFQLVESTEFVPQTALSGRTSPHSSGAWKYTDFVPRSALPNAEFKPDDPQPRIYDASEFVPRPSKPIREFKPRAPKPKVFEPAELVPRDFVPGTTVPRAQSKHYSPEPESIEPRPSINDVDYVLKSGSTRASARGRGRLWTPS